MRTRHGAARGVPLLWIALLAWPGSRALAIGGLSNSKVVTLGAETVGEKRLDLEPSLGYFWTHRYFDHHGRTHKSPVRSVSAQLAFRTTVGLLPSLEVGFSLPVNFAEQDGDPSLPSRGLGLGDIPVGLKWTFLSRKRVWLALQAGVTAPTGDDDPGPDALPTGAGYTTLEWGLGATFKPIKNMGIDWDMRTAVNVGITEDDARWTWLCGVAFGYRVRWWQPIVELHYTGAYNHGDDSHKFATTLGWTVDIHPRFTIINGVTFDVAGKREPMGFTAIIATTTRFW